jgi:hypothetical protein
MGTRDSTHVISSHLCFSLMTGLMHWCHAVSRMQNSDCNSETRASICLQKIIRRLTFVAHARTHCHLASFSSNSTCQGDTCNTAK